MLQRAGLVWQKYPHIFVQLQQFPPTISVPMAASIIYAGQLVFSSAVPSTLQRPNASSPIGFGTVEFATLLIRPILISNNAACISKTRAPSCLVRRNLSAQWSAKLVERCRPWQLLSLGFVCCKEIRRRLCERIKCGR